MKPRYLIFVFVFLAVLITGLLALRRATAPTRIMFLGDSITQGDAKRASYRRPLYLNLKAKGLAIDFVGSQTLQMGNMPAPINDFDRDHEGHYGWTTTQILKELDAWLKENPADILFLQMGTNDLMAGDDPVLIYERITQILTKVKSANSHADVILSSVLPFLGAGKGLERLNEKLKRLCTQIDKLYFIDLAEGFSFEQDTFDGVHPHEAGERKIALKLEAQIVDLLKK